MPGFEMLIMGAIGLYLMASQKSSPPEVDLDTILTEEIYDAVRAAGYDPEREMERLSESVIYPIAIVGGADLTLGPQEQLLSRLNGFEHRDHCMCAECQVDRLPPDERTNIFIEADLYGVKASVAHARHCMCDKCRFKLGIDAGKARAFLLTQSSLTTSPSDTEMSARSIECLVRWKTITPLRLNCATNLETNPRSGK